MTSLTGKVSSPQFQLKRQLFWAHIWSQCFSIFLSAHSGLAMITCIETKVIVCGENHTSYTILFFFGWGFYFCPFWSKNNQNELAVYILLHIAKNVDLKDFLCAYICICANGVQRWGKGGGVKCTSIFLCRKSWISTSAPCLLIIPKVWQMEF